MFILLLSPGFPDREDIFRPGIVDTLVALRERGHEIEVHTTRAPPQRTTTVFRGLSIVRHGTEGGVAAHVRLLRAVSKRHKRRPYDLAWSIWPNKTGLSGLAIQHGLGLPLVASLAGGELVFIPELRYGEPNQARVRRVLRAADVVTAGSATLAARASALGREVVVNPLGADFRAMPFMKSARPLERIAIIADASPIKRTRWAIEAAQMVREVTGAEVTVFGDVGPFDDVVGRGFVAPRVLRAELHDYDVSIHASAHESQGIAMIEAAYAGLGIACFDVGVARELRALGARLVIADRASPHALSAAAIAAHQRPLADQSAIAERFSAERCAARFEALFSGLSSDQPAPFSINERR